MKKLLAIVVLVFLYCNFSYADNSIEIKRFEEKNIVVLKFKVPDKKHPKKEYVLAQIHYPKNFDTKLAVIIHQHGSTRDGIKFEAWGGKTDEWGTRLIKAGLKRGYAVAVVDAFYKRGITPGSKLKFPYAIQIGITLRNILSKSENIDNSKMFYTGFSYGAGSVLELQGKQYSNQKTFKAAVAAEPGCNAVPNPVKVNISTLIIKGEESHYHPVACKSYLEMIKNVNNKVKYVSIPKVDHHFSLNGKIGTGKAFNGCSNNIVIRYFDGTWKHMDGTLTSRNETRKKCMTNNKAAVNGKTSEKLDEAIEIALNFIDKNN